MCLSALIHTIGELMPFLGSLHSMAEVYVLHLVRNWTWRTWPHHINTIIDARLSPKCRPTYHHRPSSRHFQASSARWLGHALQLHGGAGRVLRRIWNLLPITTNGKKSLFLKNGPLDFPNFLHAAMNCQMMHFFLLTFFALLFPSCTFAIFYDFSRENGKILKVGKSCLFC